MSFMPEVKMDFIPDDMTDDESEVAVEEIEDFDQEKDTKGRSQSDTYKTQEEIEEDEPPPPEKIPKAKSKRDDMDVNDIFNMPQAVIDPTVKLTKKGKPRKKRPPMTEEHKAKLALAREKAMEARKKKAQEKKENKALEMEEKELLKKQKVKRVKQLKEEVEDNEDMSKNDIIKKEQTFTKKDLEEAQLQAIMNYEKIRKSRKAEKQERQKKEAEQEALKAQLRRAVAPPQEEYNPFNGCY
jgi:hypothetical protein